LNASLQKLGQAVYAQTGPSAPEPGAQDQGGQKDQGDGTVEGEFREVS